MDFRCYRIGLCLISYGMPIANVRNLDAARGRSKSRIQPRPETFGMGAGFRRHAL